MNASSGNLGRRAGLALLLAVATAGSASAIDFAHEVVPLLTKHCGECHIGDARQGGYSMNTRELTVAGGDSGIAGLVPGQARSSEFLRRITTTDLDERMPADGEPLPAEAVAIFTRWIEAGAPWDDGFAFAGSSWEPPLALRPIELPPAVNGRTNPVDRVIDAYHHEQGLAQPASCDDRTFIRRVNLDLIGLLPEPTAVEAFVADTDPAKRRRLVQTLLGDDFDRRLQYAEHWLSFWNDLLRNDYTGTGFITGGRRQITSWLHQSLVDNKPFDQFVRELIAPTAESRGFIDGIVWRGTVNASQTVPIQFAQNVGQTFLGINLKCASCHDSFVDRWTLQETYDLAAIAAETPLELHRCEKATGQMATPGWLFSDLGQIDATAPRSQRLEQLAALMTRPENGWLSRNLVNRLWARLLGRGIVHPVAALRTRPWSEDLLDLLAGDLVAHDWDIKQVLMTICSSEAYGAVTPAAADPNAGDYVFRGPLPRRLTAEQFFDCLWQLTGTAPVQPDGDVLRVNPATSRPEHTLPPQAVWIWSNDLAQSAPGERLTFRKSFSLAGPAVHSRLVVTADNEAQVFLNGKEVTTCDDWIHPVVQSVTSHLRPGGNSILVSAANAPAGGPAALQLELRVTLADGSETTVATDDSWEWTATTFRVVNDGRPLFPGNKQPTDWAPAAVARSQQIWARAAADFTEKLLSATVSGPLPMVRAALVKATALMAALGRPNRDQVVTSRPTDLTTLEAIQLANEQGLFELFTKGGGYILANHGPTADGISNWLFTAALARPPSPAEQAAARAILTDTPTVQTVADCLWAVVMLPEFQFSR